MKYRRITALLTLLFFSCATSASTPPSPLQVFLQGNSSSELIQLVGDAGGEVTHDLRIINAVGAKLTAEQLEKVKASGKITQTIDDLSDINDREKEAEDEAKCRIRGHIELTIETDGIRWRLYNKHHKPATLQSLTMSWPESLGSLETLLIDETSLLPEGRSAARNGTITLKFPGETAPAVTTQSELLARFDRPIPVDGNNRLYQHDFDIELTFAQGCSDKLVPAYTNNHEDFYYNRVSGVEALHRQGVTGKGITVAIIDSGLWEAPALALDTKGNNRILQRFDAITSESGKPLVDESGHGTHMTSIIAHSEQTLRNGEPTGSFKGVAPDANLVPVKILDREGFAHVLEIVQAVQWVVEHREQFNIRVLNLSFARDPGWPYWEDPVNQAIMRAWQSGITVLAAAGNEGPEPGTIGSPGNLPYIITVGAVTDSWTPHTRNDDYVPDFSSQGPTDAGHVKPDLVALGGHMTGIIAPDSAMAQEQPEDTLSTGEFVSTGSSQATAFTSGVVALLLQLQPELSPDQVKCKLTSSAELAINRDGKLAYSPFQQGFGYLSPIRAITLGTTNCGDSGWDLEADLADEDHFLGPAIVGADGAPTLPGLEQAVASTPSEKGLSENRRWGVKDHIERVDYQDPGDKKGELAFDWEQLYLKEKARIEALANTPPE